MNIDILLAAYNGEDYISNQIKSILNQTYLDYKLYIRDDLSTDTTKAILSFYAKNFPRIVQIVDLHNKHHRLKINGNFSKLLEYSTSNYIMFSDQDDVWLPNKIKMSMNKMLEMENKYGKDKPLLVHTDLKIVDCNLNTISSSFWKYQNLNPKQGKNLGRLLLQNVVTGCTMMINKPLKNLVLPIPSEAIMHDWWIALVAVTFGKVDYIKTPTVLYRQHDNNDTGAKKWGIQYVINRVLNRNQIKEYFYKTVIQAEKFLDIYGEKLDDNNFKLVDTYTNLENMNFISKRVKLITKGYYDICSLRNLGLFITI